MNNISKALEKFILYRNFVQDSIVLKAADLLKLFEQTPELAEKDYYSLQQMLLEADPGSYCSGNLFQNHLCGLIAGSENAFCLQREKGDSNEVFNKIAEKELNIIKDFYNTPWEAMDAYFHNDASLLSAVYQKKAAREKPFIES